MTTPATAPVEMAVPFAINAAGGVAYTADPNQQAADAVLSVIGTQLGSRVMQPGYGVNIVAALFTSSDLDINALSAQISQAIEQWVPKVTVQYVTITPSPDGSSVNFLVAFALAVTGSTSTNVQTVDVTIPNTGLFSG